MNAKRRLTIPLTTEDIEKLLPAFEGIGAGDENIVPVLRNDLPTGMVSLSAQEIEQIANRIQELQAIVAQNALVRGDLAPSTALSDGWSE